MKVTQEILEGVCVEVENDAGGCVHYVTWARITRLLAVGPLERRVFDIPIGVAVIICTDEGFL